MERAPAGSAPGSPAGGTVPHDASAPAPAPCPVRGSSPYLPRRPQASLLYRVLADHFATLERVHEEHFESTHGPLRRAARTAVGRLLDCGLLEHGFARVRCGTCHAEFLVAFRCEGRHFCPSCHARRLAEWSLWLGERLLAPVAHFHPDLHVLMSDGVFRRDGSFVPLPEPEAMVLEGLWQRVVLAEFVRQGWLEKDAAAGMLAWPHSGFGAYLGPRIEERAGLLRVARYAARAPVAESRLRYDGARTEVELVATAPGAEVAAEPAGDWPALRARRRRWAELLRRVFQVEVERCPGCCRGTARIIAFLTEPAAARRTPRGEPAALAGGFRLSWRPGGR